MLLRESSAQIGEDADAALAMTQGDGVPHGELLGRYAEAVTKGSDDLDEVRAETHATLGDAAFVEAAATVGIFNGLVRTADSTGIPLDPRIYAGSQRERSALGLDKLSGAVSSRAHSKTVPQT